MSCFHFRTPKFCPDALWFPRFLFCVSEKFWILNANQRLGVESGFDQPINVTSR